TQAGLWLSRDGVCDLCHRTARLLRVGPPHVHQWYEPLFGDCVFSSDTVDWCAVGGEDVQLAGHVVGLTYSLYHGDAVCTGIRFAVRGGRYHGFDSRPELARSGDARHLYRDGPLPPRDGCGFDLRNVRRALLLVPEDVWPFDERADRPDSFLADIRRCLHDLCADAHHGNRRHAATLFEFR